jgi:hypothetical protein
VIAALALAWLGVGLLVCASARRAPPILLVLLARGGRGAPVGVRWTLRALGVAALGACGWALAPGCDGALVLVALVLTAMACGSIAALVAPLRPRLYLASVIAAAVVSAMFAW